MRHAYLLVFMCSIGILASQLAKDPAIAEETEAGSSSNVEAEVTAVIQESAARWTAQESTSVLELWDRDDPRPMYLAAERDDWLIGWEEVSNYIIPSGPNSALEAMRKRVSNIRVKQVAPDLAIATWNMHLDMKFRGQLPIGNNIRLTGVLRKKPQGWRFIHYAEAPMTPLVYIRNFYQDDVEPEFQEVYESALKKRANKGSPD